MGKKTIWSIAFLFLIGIAGWTVWAKEESKETQQTLTGRVVCPYCYLSKGATGMEHAKCAAKCFSKGLPAGLEVGNQLYLLEGKDREPYNRRLERYAEKEITVTGKVYQKDGMNLIVVDKMD